MDEQNNRLLYAKIFFESNNELSSKFPLKFKHTTAERYNCACVQCGEPIEDTNVRGSVKMLLADVYEINAVALCKPCALFNVHENVRLREDDGKLAKQYYIEGKGWVTQVFDPQKKGWLERIVGI